MLFQKGVYNEFYTPFWNNSLDCKEGHMKKIKKFVINEVSLSEMAGAYDTEQQRMIDRIKCIAFREARNASATVTN